jgi:hypothetical protein
MAINHHDQPCECEDLKRQQQRECKEKTEQQAIKIAALEKKIMMLTIIGVIAMTVIGKEMTDKIINTFSNVQQVQQKLTGDMNVKASDSSGVGNNDPFRSK